MKKYAAPVIAVVVLAVVVIGYLVQSQRDTTGEEANAPAPSASASASASAGSEDALVDGYGVLVGDPKAAKTITIYEDFQCPRCAEFEATTRDALKQAIADKKVAVDYRMVTFLDTVSLNAYSSRALNAAAVVFDRSGTEVFVKFHDLLFDQQPAEGTAGPSNEQLIDLAVQAGADRAAITDGINSGEFNQWGTNATDDMSKNGVNGTPGVVVDGKLADNPLQAIADLVK